ncbi:MAG: flavodoxin [Spirochaetaceae bacterium]|nr:MAG: flavodoxin [Spirochaetaceae bacterium]
MNKIGIFYGSTTGNTRDVTLKLYEALGKNQAEMHDIRETTASDMQAYDKIVFSVSTWGTGDLQDDWEEFFPSLNSIDFNGKTVAIMALGDQQNYPDNFVDCMRPLAEKVIERGGRIVGETPTEGYTFSASKAVQSKRFLGLVIDEDNQANMTTSRIHDWVEVIKQAMQ